MLSPFRSSSERQKAFPLHKEFLPDLKSGRDDENCNVAPDPLWSRNGRVLLDAFRLAHLADRTPVDFGIIFCELLLIQFVLLKEPDLHGSPDAKPK